MLGSRYKKKVMNIESLAKNGSGPISSQMEAICPRFFTQTSLFPDQQFDQARVFSQFAPFVDAEFAVNIANVHMHGIRRSAELLSDLSFGQSMQQQYTDTFFCRAQANTY